MKRRIFAFLLALSLMLSLIPAVNAAETPVNVTVPGTEQHTYAAEVVDIVNTNRADNGLSALSRNATLSELAMLRAAEVALYFSHTRPDGTDCFTVIDGVYSGWTTVGENIAIGQGDPAEVMDSWMTSEGHRENILTAEYTQIGVGCFYADGIYCWVQLFSNSTTNTATTSATGSETCARDVAVLPSNLNLSPCGEQAMELEAGESDSLIITTTNPEFSYCQPALIPLVENLTDADGNTIASITAGEDGTVTITAQNPGSGVAEIAVYAGQPDPLTLTVTVPGAATQPTEPEPTEPEPTQSEPTEPEPTQPEPTEPEPTQPEPTEPEPTEPEPTEPHPTEHTHSYTAVVTDPTCTEKGYTTYTCACGDSYISDEVEPLGHSFADGFCSACGEKDPNKPDHYHVYEEWIVTEFPSATSDGSKYSVCTICGNTLTTDIMYLEDGPADGHSLWVANANGYGSADLSACKAEAGHDVFLHVVPSEGTVTESIQILDDHTDVELDVELTDLGGGYYHFLMPDTDVCVSVTNIRFGDYTITVTTPGGGDVWISTDVANEGEVFLLTVSADDGYYLDQIYLYSDGTYAASGRQISETDFEITMPDGNLEIEVCFVPYASPFSDVRTSDYFYEPVLWAVGRGITSGISETRFGPNNPCTRAQVVTFLWRAAGSPEPSGYHNPFSDVKQSDYFYKAVLWAVENGITGGTSATTFGPNNPCTRAQVVTFLWRACGSPAPSGSYNPFTDVDEGDYFYEAVLFAVEYGITSGVSQTRFGSNNTCTRGQVVTFLYKTFHG